MLMAVDCYITWTNFIPGQWKWTPASVQQFKQTMCLKPTQKKNDRTIDKHILWSTYLAKGYKPLWEYDSEKLTFLSKY